MYKNYDSLRSGRDTWLKNDVGDRFGSPPGMSNSKGESLSGSFIRFLFLTFVLLGLSSTTALAQCLGSGSYPNGKWPSANFTPTNTGAAEPIVTNGFAGEYSGVVLVGGQQYVFSSSVSTDLITISTTTTFTAAVAFANGGPVTYTPPSSGTYFFGTNLAGCGSDSVNRTRFIQTILPPCVAPSAQPTGLGLTPNALSISGSFTASSPAATGYLVVRYPAGSTPTNPTDGVTYAAAATLGAGTVVQAGSATTFNATGLAFATNYDFYIYAYRN